jgi:glyoxylate reductase
MKPKVSVTKVIPYPCIELLSESCDVTVRSGEGAIAREELLGAIGDKDGLLCILSDRIDGEILDASKNIKVINTYSVGFDHMDVTEATRREIFRW